MGLGYGTQIPLAVLSRRGVAAPQATKAKQEGFGIFGFLRILITIAEIGAAFIPGIGAIAETGIGLAAGAANQALDATTGGTSVVGSLLNFGSPLVGGGFTGLKNVGSVGKAVDKAANLERGIIRTGLQDTSKFWEKNFELAGILRSSTTKGSFSYTSKYSAFNKGISGFSNKLAGNIGSQGFYGIESMTKGFGKISKVSSTGLKVGDNVIREAFEDENFVRTLGKSGLSTAAIAEWKLAIKEARNLDEARSILFGLTRDLGDRDAIKLFRNLTKSIENVALKEANQLPLIREFSREFDNAAKKALVNYDKQISKQAEQSTLSKYFKKVNSAKFNDQVVQNVQLIDPNDLGRAGIERLYQALKNRINKYFKKTGKLLKEAENIEDAFVRSGGVLVDSLWHLGYKVVKDLGLNKQLIMISFKAAESAGKKPVFVIATDYQIKKYIASPGHYYNNTWAYSKGGKKLGIGNIFGSVKGLANVSTQGMSILPFIPVQALKNIISIVSNLVENFSDMGKGVWVGEYKGKFLKSLRNSAISRTFRLGGKVIAGGAATKFFGKSIGRFIGAELQRVGTQIAATSIKNVIDGKSATTNLKRNAIRGALVSVRSNALRKLRRKRGHNSVIINSLTARRKLQVVKRIPNAVMPGRPFAGIKIK